MFFIGRQPVAQVGQAIPRVDCLWVLVQTQ